MRRSSLFVIVLLFAAESSTDTDHFLFPMSHWFTALYFKFRSSVHVVDTVTGLRGDGWLDA